MDTHAITFNPQSNGTKSIIILQAPFESDEIGWGNFA